jgi:hypothetical protein
VIRKPTPREVVDLGFTHVVGLRAWGPSVGVGSFLTVEFGSPRITSAGITQGAFHLWVYGSSWEIRERRKSIATSEHDRSAMIAGARALDDALVRSFEFDQDLMTLTIRFDPDFELVMRPLGDLEMEEWFLYLDDGTVITAGPGKSVTLESATGSSGHPRG